MIKCAPSEPGSVEPTLKLLGPKPNAGLPSGSATNAAIEFRFGRVFTIRLMRRPTQVVTPEVNPLQAIYACFSRATRQPFGRALLHIFHLKSRLLPYKIES